MTYIFSSSPGRARDVPGFGHVSESPLSKGPVHVVYHRVFRQVVPCRTLSIWLQPLTDTVGAARVPIALGPLCITESRLGQVIVARTTHTAPPG